MSMEIQRQADQWSLSDRQASSTYEPSQAELRDLLGGPRIQSGLLNTREASKGRRSNTIRQAVPRENPAGNLNMSPRKLDQQVTKEVQNKALKPPKPKPIPDDLGQDQSFKVPNQLKAHVDPPLPPRNYLASFIRHAEEPKKKDIVPGDPTTYGLDKPQDPTSGMLAPAGGPDASAPDSGGASNSSIVIGDPTTYPGVNKGPQDPTGGLLTPGGTATPGAAPSTPKAETPSTATTVGDTKPSTGGGGGAPSGGGGGGTPGGGWSERSIAPGSIDTSKPYTVQQGDTLSNIAQGAGLSGYDQLAKDNGIANPDLINVGQEIKFSPSPGGPSTPVSETPAAATATGAPESSGTPVPSGSPGADVGGAANAISAPLPGGEAAGLPPVPGRVGRYIDPPLPPKGQLKKFLAGSRRLADTEEERKRGTQYSPENTNPGLNNPAAPAPGGGQPNTPWFTPPTPSSSDAAPGPTPSEKAGEPIKPPTPTAPPSQPTSPNTPASSDATQDSPVKTNDLANASNPNSPKPSEPAGNPAQPASPSGTDKPKTPGSYGPDIGNGFSLSDAMGVIGGIGQGINTAISSIGTIGSGLMGALNGGGLSGLISGFGGLGMLGSTLGITAAAQQQIEASERAVKEQYV